MRIICIVQFICNFVILGGYNIPEWRIRIPKSEESVEHAVRRFFGPPSDEIPKSAEYVRSVKPIPLEISREKNPYYKRFKKLYRPRFELYQFCNFSDLDMRVGEILDVQRHPFRRVYIMTVNIGYNITVFCYRSNKIPIFTLIYFMVPIVINIRPLVKGRFVSNGVMPMGMKYNRFITLQCPRKAIPGDRIRVAGYPPKPIENIEWGHYCSIMSKCKLKKKKVFYQNEPWLATSEESIIIGEITSYKHENGWIK